MYFPTLLLDRMHMSSIVISNITNEDQFFNKLQNLSQAYITLTFINLNPLFISFTHLIFVLYFVIPDMLNPITKLFIEHIISLSCTFPTITLNPPHYWRSITLTFIDLKIWTVLPPCYYYYYYLLFKSYSFRRRKSSYHTRNWLDTRRLIISSNRRVSNGLISKSETWSYV